MCRWELASVWGLASVFAVACLPARVCVVPRWLLGRSALPWRTCSLAHVRCRGNTTGRTDSQHADSMADKRGAIQATLLRCRRRHHSQVHASIRVSPPLLSHG